MIGLLQRLRDSLKAPEPEPARERILRRFAEERECPFCQTKNEFLRGPEGGASVNVMCRACGSRLNVAHTGGRFPFMEVTHGPQPEVWDGNAPWMFPDPATVQRVTQEIEDR